MTFDDGIAGRRHALTALDVGIPFVSTLPYDTDILVKPRVSGALDTAQFALEGSTVPFAERREATLDSTSTRCRCPPTSAICRASRASTWPTAA